MPTKSEQQRKLIFTKRSIYKTKEKTPDKWKWIWDKGWENKGSLPEKVSENISLTSMVKQLNEDAIQDKADKINQYAKAIKSKQLEWASQEYISERDYPSIDGLLKSYKIVNNKYLSKEELDIFNELIKDDNEYDPAGGRGLHSHI